MTFRSNDFSSTSNTDWPNSLFRSSRFYFLICSISLRLRRWFTRVSSTSVALCRKNFSSTRCSSSTNIVQRSIRNRPTGFFIEFSSRFSALNVSNVGRLPGETFLRLHSRQRRSRRFVSLGDSPLSVIRVGRGVHRNSVLTALSVTQWCQR